jgi:hypothetical protein
MDGAGVFGAGGAVGEIICADAGLPEIASTSIMPASRIRIAVMRLFMEISSRPNLLQWLATPGIAAAGWATLGPGATVRSALNGIGPVVYG